MRRSAFRHNPPPLCRLPDGRPRRTVLNKRVLGARLSEYKLYCLDRNGRIMRRLDLEAGDDDRALAAARDLSPEVDRELWCGTRKIALLSAARV